MKVIIFFIILICLLIPVSAQLTSTATARITLTIINENPEITNINIIPEQVYPNSEITCSVEIKDESPELVTKETAWYVNGKFITRSEAFTDFKIGDEVGCRVVAIDIAGQHSKEEKASIIAKQPPLETQLLGTAMNIAGTKTNTNELIELQQQGLVAITGHAINNSSYRGETGILGMLIVVLVFVFLMNLRIVLKKRERITST
jgi:hypothetical protein